MAKVDIKGTILHLRNSYEHLLVITRVDKKSIFIIQISLKEC